MVERIVFLIKIFQNYFICTLKILKLAFLVHNIDLYLCWHVENDKWILCSRKKGVKRCAY